MNKIYIVKEKNSKLVHAIITEFMVPFFKQHFSVFDIIEISSIGFASGTIEVEGKKIGINTFSCHESLTINSVGEMIRTWNSEHSYFDIIKAMTK